MQRASTRIHSVGESQIKYMNFVTSCSQRVLNIGRHTHFPSFLVSLPKNFSHASHRIILHLQFIQSFIHTFHSFDSLAADANFSLYGARHCDAEGRQSQEQAKRGYIMSYVWSACRCALCGVYLQSFYVLRSFMSFAEPFYLITNAIRAITRAALEADPRIALSFIFVCR